MSAIGSWARRIRLSEKGPLVRPLTRAHFVESEIAQRLVVHCGRELAFRRDEPFEFELQQPADACLRCKPAGAPVSEERLARYVG